MNPTMNVIDIAVSDLDAAIVFYRRLGHEELTGAGAAGLQEPWDAFWGMRYATVADPAGNEIDLYANLPAS